MKIVAITACPTGIAHTYMAAEQLERAGRARGHQVKVETQGAMGIENELTAQEIAEADCVIFAADIEIEQRHRFDGKRIIEVPPQQAIKDAGAIFDQLNL